jgi:hypothetical protein
MNKKIKLGDIEVNYEELRLRARIPFTINVYEYNGQDIIEIIDTCWTEDIFYKGSKEHASRFLKDMARIFGVEIEVK